jgi:nucleotidyltransferase/DNA polymerase involved in DNA repair
VLKSFPLAVQQKQIIATCNYEARRRGLKKLQLIREAKKICPDVVIVLGEDLAPFRDASKELYSFLRAFVWGDRVEKLGFDEVGSPLSVSVRSTVGLTANVGIFGCHGNDRIQCRVAQCSRLSQLVLSSGQVGPHSGLHI